jgi:hypothetical protein
MNTKAREQLVQALMLLEDNGRTSASTSGLKHRAINNIRAREILRELLGIDEVQADHLYWEWVEREARSKNEGKTADSPRESEGMEAARRIGLASDLGLSMWGLKKC